MLPENLISAIRWTICTEPGDEFAGLMREVLGSVEALDLVEQASAAAIVATLTDVGAADDATHRFGDLSKVAADSLERWLPRLKADGQRKIIASVESGRFKVVLPEDQSWPQGLNDLGWAAPAALWVAGDVTSLEFLGKSIALVGSRTASAYGASVTNDLVSALSEFGYAVVSGGAYGIDAIAHRASVSLDNQTFAVMAGGLDRMYPTANQELLQQIAEKWAVVSEMPPGSSPTKWRFLQRNRLIAALSQATIVIEAGWRSGSINTARHAEHLGRGVGAVPGPITSQQSAGCHRLIREGVANLITSIDDIKELLGENVALIDLSTQSVGPLEKRALDALKRTWQVPEKIALTAGLTSSETNMALTSLESDALAESSLLGWRRIGSNL